MQKKISQKFVTVFLLVVFSSVLTSHAVMGHEVPWEAPATTEQERTADLDRTVLFEALAKLSSGYVIPKSNLDWMFQKLRLAQKKIVPDFDLTMTTRITGKVVDISSERGQLPLSKDRYYYVGKAGFFKYQGKITVLLENKKTIDIFLSERRMELLKVTVQTAEGESENSFDDIKVGDVIELEERVDLAFSNRNDGNVEAIFLRIFRD